MSKNTGIAVYTYYTSLLPCLRPDHVNGVLVFALSILASTIEVYIRGSVIFEGLATMVSSIGKVSTETSTVGTVFGASIKLSRHHQLTLSASVTQSQSQATSTSKSIVGIVFGALVTLSFSLVPNQP